MKYKYLILVFLLILINMSLSAEKNFLDSPRILKIGLELIGKTDSASISTSNGIIEITNSSKKVIFNGKAEKLYISAKPKGNIEFEINKKKYLASNTAIISNKNPREATIKLSAPSKNSKTYRGRLQVKLLGAKLYWLNLVDMEDYLKSVVPSEISTRAPKSAIEAQTIAARTYAIRNLDRHIQRSGYNLCDTIHCQAYFGVSKEYKDCNSAVKATEGKILVFSDSPANTVYHSNCGGYIISSQTAWGGKSVPYLIGHYDGIKGEKSFCEYGKSYLSKHNNLVLPEKTKRLVIGVTASNSKKKTHSNFGHRVGMCQDGAIGMAAIGYTCSNILGFYYPKTKIETLKYASGNKSDKYAPTKVTSLADLKSKNKEIKPIDNKNTKPNIVPNTNNENQKVTKVPGTKVATQSYQIASTPKVELLPQTKSDTATKIVNPLTATADNPKENISLIASKTIDIISKEQFVASPTLTTDKNNNINLALAQKETDLKQNTNNVNTLPKDETNNIDNKLLASNYEEIKNIKTTDNNALNATNITSDTKDDLIIASIPTKEKIENKSMDSTTNKVIEFKDKLIIASVTIDSNKEMLIASVQNEENNNINTNNILTNSNTKDELQLASCHKETGLIHTNNEILPNTHNNIIIASLPKEENDIQELNLNTNSFSNKKEDKYDIDISSFQNSSQRNNKSNIKNILKEISLTKPNPASIVLKKMYWSPANSNIRVDSEFERR